MQASWIIDRIIDMRFAVACRRTAARRCPAQHTSSAAGHLHGFRPVHLPSCSRPSSCIPGTDNTLADAGQPGTAPSHRHGACRIFCPSEMRHLTHASYAHIQWHISGVHVLACTPAGSVHQAHLMLSWFYAPKFIFFAVTKPCPGTAMLPGSPMQQAHMP